MIISLIAAVDSKNGIGLNGVMPWGHIKEDMHFFRSTTTGYPVVMGRITFESLGCKPLPKRKNIVISSNTNDDISNQYDNLFYEKSFEDPNQMNKLKDFIIDAVGGYKKAIKYGVDKLNYKLIFFDDEFDMIKTLFQIINTNSPDVLLIWNMAFDLNYIIARIEKLGYDPKSVICNPDFQVEFLRFYVDDRNKNEYDERGDYVNISSYTIWLDQMIQFASRRKGRGTYPSFRLDAIGEDVADVRKLDYSNITSDINMLPYLNYEIFSFYNIMDTIVQKCIETVTQDCEYVFMKCNINNTRYSKCHRQSVYLRNRFTKDFYNYGYIIGNNNNANNEKPNTKFAGAFVHDVTHNSPFSMMWINGRPTLLCNNMVDFD